MGVEDYIIEELREGRQQRSRNPVKPHHRKTAGILKENARFMIQEFGVGHCAAVTLTCRKRISLKKARALFSKLTPSLDSLFPAWLAVLDFNARPHFHLLVAVRSEIREGFSCENYLAMRALSAAADLTEEQKLQRQELGRSLTTNSKLKALWRHLKKVAVKAGFNTRSEICPLREEPDKAINYCLGVYFQVVRAVAGKGLGLRILSRSRKYPWPRKSPVVSIENGTRHKFRAIGEALGVSYDEMKEHFGPKWAFHLRPAFDELETYQTRDPANWDPARVRPTALSYLKPDFSSRFYDEAMALREQAYARRQAQELIEERNAGGVPFRGSSGAISSSPSLPMQHDGGATAPDGVLSVGCPVSEGSRPTILPGSGAFQPTATPK